MFLIIKSKLKKCKCDSQYLKKIMKINHEEKNSNQSEETYPNYDFKTLAVENFTLLIFQTFLVIL